MLELPEANSIATVQRHFCTFFDKEPPSQKNTYHWYNQFEETGSVCKRRSTGRPRVSDAVVDRIREAFKASLQKSTYQASRQLQLPQKTIWRVLHKRLVIKPYKLQMVQALTPNDKIVRHQFCVEMQVDMEDEDFVGCLVFTDEATFHVNGKVTRHNLRIQGTENPHSTSEHVWDSPKMNVFCAITQMKIYGPFIFMEDTVTRMTYLDMLQQWLIPQLDDDSNNYLFQQDGAPPHYHNAVWRYLNEHLLHCWIGRATANDLAFRNWPPGHLTLPPVTFPVGVCEGRCVHATPATRSARVTTAYCYCHRNHRRRHGVPCMART
jgi:transposase